MCFVKLGCAHVFGVPKYVHVFVVLKYVHMFGRLKYVHVFGVLTYVHVFGVLKCVHMLWCMTVSTENATSSKSSVSRNSDFSVSCGTNSNPDFGLI